MFAPTSEEARLGPQNSAKGIISGDGLVCFTVIQGGQNVGKISVYKRVGTTWSLESTITNTTTDNYFGTHVDSSYNGDVVITSSPATGKVYIYTYDGSLYNLTQTLTHGDSQFGSGISISGDGLVISVTAWIAGSVLLYRHNGTSYILNTRTILNSGNSYTMNCSTTVNGEKVVAGKYVLKYNGTTYVQEAILATTKEHSSSISSDGTMVVVGPGTNGTGNAISIFSYDGTTWSKDIDITSSMPIDAYGKYLKLSGNKNMLLVGAQGGLSNAKVFLYKNNSGTWSNEILITTANPLGQFGTVIDITDDGSRCLVGPVSPSGVNIYA